jgi:hypothetical protein
MIDSLSLASHVVPVDASHTFESFFNQLKQEYVAARWMAYEGLSSEATHFSDRDVPLTPTLPRPALALAVERMKASYRVCYSLFDKIAFLLNAYMQLGIEEKAVSFRSVWRSRDKQPLRAQFDPRSKNWGFCALSWVARDFFERETEEVAEPEARNLREIRNHLEHKYLRVTVDSNPTNPPDDLAFNVSREEFAAKCLHLLALARSALIYLSVGVRFEELRRAPSRADLQIEELPATPELPDAEKK